MVPKIQNKELHRVVTTTIVYKPDFKYLIIKRASHKNVQPGKWCFPGGGLEADDYISTPHSTSGGQWYGALEKSLRREIKEEVNIEIGTPEFFKDFTFVTPDGIPVLGFTYFASYVSGEVKLDEDATDFAWVTLEETKKYDLIGGLTWELSQVDKILKSRKKKK